MATETKKRFDTPYDAGYDAGMNGANTFNCSLHWFNTKKDTAEWERGNKAGSAKRESNSYNKKSKHLKQ